LSKTSKKGAKNAENIKNELKTARKAHRFVRRELDSTFIGVQRVVCAQKYDDFSEKLAETGGILSINGASSRHRTEGKESRQKRFLSWRKTPRKTFRCDITDRALKHGNVLIANVISSNKRSKPPSPPRPPRNAVY
jgi:hypothetical protein